MPGNNTVSPSKSRPHAVNPSPARFRAGTQKFQRAPTATAHTDTNTVPHAPKTPSVRSASHSRKDSPESKIEFNQSHSKANVSPSSDQSFVYNILDSDLSELPSSSDNSIASLVEEDKIKILEEENSALRLQVTNLRKGFNETNALCLTANNQIKSLEAMQIKSLEKIKSLEVMRINMLLEHAELEATVEEMIDRAQEARRGSSSWGGRCPCAGAGGLSVYERGFGCP